MSSPDASPRKLPTYEQMMLPLLRVLAERGELHQDDYAAAVADVFQLTDAERAIVHQSNGEASYRNRAGWAGWYMQQAGLVEKPRRGILRITDAGRALLAAGPERLDNRYLAAHYPSFVARVIERRKQRAAERGGAGGDDGTVLAPTAGGATGGAPAALAPDEAIERAYEQLNDALVADLLDKVRSMNPYHFEKLVLDVLVAMGYGGSIREAAEVTKKSGDEGIDGLIKQDRLGLDVIYVQAKRYAEDQVIGREKIQSFVGALAGQQAQKGVFIASCRFSQGARDYARNIPQKVILIDGDRLAELMIEHGVGVTTVRRLELKRLDSDYFEDP
ncbi:MAG: restriction endonuclease [Verrucomicrobia bacterium]|nr:restriction endonuclease [Verrucomicrobiota bacterium]